MASGGSGLPGHAGSVAGLRSVVNKRLRDPRLPLPNITLVEVFVVTAQLVNVTLVQGVLQSVDPKVMTEVVSQSEKIVVHLSFQGL